MAGQDSLIFPGIIPAAIQTGGQVAMAGINEISELMRELGRPTLTQVEYEYDRKGRVVRTRSWQISKLDALIIVGGPAFIALFYVLMERLAAVGGNWGPGDKLKEVVGPMGQWLQDRAAARGGQVGTAAQQAWGMFQALWEQRPGPKFI